MLPMTPKGGRRGYSEALLGCLPSGGLSVSIAVLADSESPPGRRRSTSGAERRCISALRYTLFQLRSAPIYPRRLEGGSPSQLGTDTIAFDTARPPPPRRRLSQSASPSFALASPSFTPVHPHSPPLHLRITPIAKLNAVLADWESRLPGGGPRAMLNAAVSVRCAIPCFSCVRHRSTPAA